MSSESNEDPPTEEVISVPENHSVPSEATWTAYYAVIAMVIIILAAVPSFVLIGIAYS